MIAIFRLGGKPSIDGISGHVVYMSNHQLMVLAREGLNKCSIELI